MRVPDDPAYTSLLHMVCIVQQPCGAVLEFIFAIGRKEAIMSKSGLEGVIVGQSRLSYINGDQGELIYGGYEIDDLARNTTFEEVCYMLWNGKLPNSGELEGLRHELEAARRVDPRLLEMIRSFPHDADPMAALRTAVSAMGLMDPQANDNSEPENRRKAILMTAQMPVLIAAYDRFRAGKDPVEPKAGLDTAANFLYMLNGEEADEARVRAMDTALVLHAEHGMNASTFAARVTAGTLADIYSAVVSAIGTLKGASHGGANVEVMRQLREIMESGTDPKQYVRDTLAAGKRMMGFGHRVYKVRDPRADVLATAAELLYATDGDEALYGLALEVERTAVALLAEHKKPERNLQTNVEFYTALLLHGLDLPTELFTPTFAIGRVAGWTAHCFEQRERGRLIRPQSEYVGERDRRWVPIEER